ncbi:hypothetical protein [Natronocalculus amylovorans]|uniref:DUF5658 domain-containing protein n=1 Tax=Natronocalculus amylovorans TaxID=2917812 RepID=A0AAE3K8A3_9EURY|nr:hypothetical protein [Natronocalculus amylovorans]MCL9816836.1 hypothetical protein [Natronocalculus amylovorans]
MAGSPTVSIASLIPHERALWLCAIVFYGIGDTVTTMWGLSTGGVAEIGPIVGPLVDGYGTLGLFTAKIGSFVVFFGVWKLLWLPLRLAIPLALSVVGVGVTVWNLFAIVPAL